MTTLLSAQSVCYDNSNSSLLHEVTFSVKKGDRIGLIGYNGSGKSTLLKILSGELEAHTGSVIVSRQCVLARVEQYLPDTLLSSTLLDSLLARLPEDRRHSESWRCETLLMELGFSPGFWNLKVENLSGGQHTRLLLARALILQPDLMLLDEPSNHLDLPTLLWLETFLTRWRGTFILVSHDSYLLDKVTTSTLILRDKTLQLIRLPCTAARQLLQEKDVADVERYQAEQKEIERVEKSARRLADWGRIYDNEGLARKSLEMIKRVNRLKEEQTILTEGSQWRLRLHGDTLEADRVLALSEIDVRPAPDAKVLFSMQQKQIKSGDRIAIIGSNGIGKSTLLKYLWHEYQQPVSPQVVFHPKVHVGYYDQNLYQLQDEDTIIDAMAKFSSNGEELNKIALINAGFSYSRHKQLVLTLSWGERARLLFVGLTLAKYSLLLLDEPTNHLDLEGKEELEETLSQFTGALLMVTHDRRLIEKSCNRYWVISNNRLEEWNDISSAYEYLAKAKDNPHSQDKSNRDTTGILYANDEEELLNKLLSLEEKLHEDLARKTKHQKPDMQTRWRQEIDAIKEHLNID
ncbi:Transporter [Xenorhabdus poinarii G6]|uniref:Transporter n=1 Tax=Xenorhabdus poinarii G6 TaxID=1354304 RepID=A0A068R2M2_9GAMM|nr:ABC-F family ATP-binding cassette domain-containing protein [Xenorhabdus poinarii]CDG21537.1 Transporter [Xenorhabdus poinarii G6]